MFEPFSAGYYLGRFAVAPHDGERALLQRSIHERINEALYTTGEGLEALDYPLVMKLENSHLPVYGDDSVPARTLAIPRTLLESLRIENPPTDRAVLLATAERASQLLEPAGDTTETG